MILRAACMINDAAEHLSTTSIILHALTGPFVECLQVYLSIKRVCACATLPALLPVVLCCCAPTEFMPAAVDPEAPKASRPALCLVSDAGVQPGSAFSCDASENYMRRLCPCIKGPGSSSSSKSSSSTKASSRGSGQEEGGSRGEGDRQGVSSSSKSSGSSSRGGDAAAVPADKQQQQEQQVVSGPGQLGATQTEGVGDDAAETGAADGEGGAAEDPEYDEDPNRGDEGN